MPDAPRADMLIPFAGAYADPEQPDARVPELVPIDELTGAQIEAAEAEIEAEERWHRSA